MLRSIGVVLAGYISAWLAKTKPWQHVLGLLIFGELMGVVSMAFTWNLQPHWYGLNLLVLYPPCVLLGGWLRLRPAR